MTEPLACPFCGTKMHLHDYCFSHPRPEKGDCILRHYSFDKQAVKAWNTRKRPPLPGYDDEISDEQFAAIQRLARPSANPDTELAEELAAIVNTLNSVSPGSLNHRDLGAWVMVNSDRLLTALRRPTPEPLDTHPEIVGDPGAKILSYNHAHQDAVGMGYPSLTEALEHLSELKAATPERDEVIELAGIIALNAKVIDDPRMKGMTECYAVPLDDIDSLRAALKSTPEEQ